MADIKLHRCSWTFVHNDLDSCWKVQRALDEQGIAYEVVKHGYGSPKFKMGDRSDIKALTGQQWLPVLEFPDGSTYRAESDVMAARIRSGEPLTPDA